MTENNLTEQLQENCTIYCRYKNIKRYKIVDNRYIVFNISHNADYHKMIRRFTLQYKVDLLTLQEVSIIPLKRFDKKSLVNGRD